MRSRPATGILAGMHPHLHMQLARAIRDERLRDAEARHRIGQARQLSSPSATHDRRLRRELRINRKVALKASAASQAHAAQDGE